MDSPLKIAIDFDGTIVEHKYPEIGKEIIFAFQTLRALQEQGHQLILWTYRSGKELDDAVEYCRRNGIEFYAINSSYPEEVFDEDYDSRKIDADIFIDDRNIGGLPSWGEIYQMINPNEKPTLEEEVKSLAQNRRSLFQKLVGR
jgi:hydroxymethylpyrimidine pyrophosphatase-like HAD family hydrolase